MLLIIRSYILSCEDGACGPEEFPSCKEKFEWENIDVRYENCEPIVFKDRLRLCGEGGEKVDTKTKEFGQGIILETVHTSCKDCDMLGVWTPWVPCTDEDGLINRPYTLCRQLMVGNISIKEEEKSVAAIGRKYLVILFLLPCSRCGVEGWK